MNKSNWKTNRNLALLALVITAACFPVFGIVARLVDVGFEPLTQVYLRIGLGLILALLFFQNNMRWGLIGRSVKKDWKAILLMGVVGYSISTYFTTLGALNTKLVNVTVVGTFVPFFVYLYSLLVFRQRVNFKILALILLSVLGIATVATNSFPPSISSFGKGEFFVLLYAAAAWYVIGRKQITTDLNNSEITILAMLVAFVSTVIVAIVSKETFIWQNFLGRGVVLGLATGGALNVVVIFLQNFAYRHLEGVLASQILLISTIFSLSYGYLIYRETVTIVEIGGSLLVILSVFVNNILLSNRI